MKTQKDDVKENRFKNVIGKQKIIIDKCIKLKEKNKNNKDNLINRENSFQKNIKIFNFLSNKKYKNDNKNKDIMNYIDTGKRNIIYGYLFKKENK